MLKTKQKLQLKTYKSYFNYFRSFDEAILKHFLKVQFQLQTIIVCLTKVECI